MESEEALKKLQEDKIPMVSALSIKEPIDDEQDKHGKSYKGPFYVDIDVEGDPKTSIKSAIQFADKLQEYGVTDYEVYLSGKKGFHFIIPMAVFASARPVKSLPLIYREMALEMFVEGLDLSVYNEARPRLIRAPNVRRKDNGKYKVQITVDELYGMTEENYQKLSESPRPLHPVKSGTLSLAFQTLYESCKITMQKKQKARENMEFVPDEELKKTVGPDGKLPTCINLLIEQGDTKEKSNFNQASIQFATYMVKAGVKDWKKHAKDMARNVKSSTYNTEMARYHELVKMVNYVAASPNYGFSKAMLFSVMEPCRDCAICNGTIEDSEIVPEDYEQESDLFEMPHGYFVGLGKQKRQITTFTLEIKSKFIDIPEDDSYGETRVGANALIKVNGHRRELVTILEDAWNSTRGFKQVIQGKGNYAFYGNEVDLQKIQHLLFSNEDDMTEITYVHSIGIHRHKVGGRTQLVYVEPGFSVSSTKQKNTHQVWGSIPAPPNVKETEYPAASEDLKILIDNMLECNDPEVTSTLIGWMALCHIKMQLTMRDNQFPLLNLWGNSSSGKSALSSVFARLHAVDYMLEHSPLSLQGTTPWAAAQYCTTSETVPRLLEEFNRGEIQGWKYDGFTGMLKAAWNAQSFGRGSVEKTMAGGQRVSGAHVEEAKICAPICVMSEQAPERPALRSRMIQLNIKKAGREIDGRTDKLYYVIDHKELMRGLARAMVWNSLGTHPEWVVKTMNSYNELVPREIDARPHFSYKALLTGVRFFCNTLLSIGLEPEYVEQKYEFMVSAVLNKLNDTLEEVKIEKSRTEVSLVISEMAVMADSHKTGMNYTIEDGINYLRTDEALYIDPLICHTYYTRWARQAGDKVRISSEQQFRALLSQEDFFMEFCFHPDLGGGSRQLAKMNLETLAARGIDVNMFVRSE
ncbi:MAG: hypothetical protein PVI43_00230 [Candidatus Bathyarchaeota archaeon]